MTDSSDAGSAAPDLGEDDGAVQSFGAPKPNPPSPPAATPPPAQPAPASSPALSPSDHSAFDAASKSLFTDKDESAFNAAVTAETPTLLQSLTGMLGPPATKLLPASMVGPKELTEAQRGTILNSQLWNLASAFGHGAFDYEKSTVADDTEKSLLDATTYKNYLNAADIQHKSFMDGLVVPAIKTIGDAVNATMARVDATVEQDVASVWNLPGAAFSGVSAAATQVGEEQKDPRIGSDLNLYLEQMGAEGGVGHAPHELAEPVQNVLHAQAEHAIEPVDGEAKFFGNTPLDDDRAAAAREAGNAALPERPPAPAPPAVPPTSDIHTLARQIDPEAFAQYDPAMAQHEAYTGQLADMADERDAQLDALQDAQQKHLDDTAPYNDQIANLQNRLEKAGRKDSIRYQNRIDDLTAQNEAWKDQQRQQDGLADLAGADTEDMAAVRAARDENMGQIQAIADTGRIRVAYAEAQRQLQGPTVEGDGAQIADPDPPAAAPEAAPTAEPEPAAEPTDTAPATPQRPIDEQLAHIQNDYARQVEAAGRPAEEAQAAGQIEAARYQTLAEQYPKFSAEEWYRRESAPVKAGRVRATARELAQRDLQQGANGKLTLGPDGRNTITLFERGNASTLIHEKQMKADAKALRDYAGFSDKEPETKAEKSAWTRGHEKVARSFERYLMEGVAPSKQLAGVFAKFRGWLTSLYKTVDHLKAPINDSIRGVFDRLLSSAPEKTVIAADHEPGKMMADIHEEDADHTPPEHAAEVRDNIEREIDRTARLHNPEIADALRNAGTEPRPVGVTAEGAGDAADEGSQQVGSGAAEASDQIAEGGGQSGGESGQVRGQQGDGAGGAPEPGASPSGSASNDAGNPATGSADAGGSGRATDSTSAPAGDAASANRTASRPSRDDLIDKAGNIRLDKLNNPADIDEILRQGADENDGFVAQRRVGLSATDMIELAESMGVDPGFLNEKKVGDAFSGEQIIKAKQMLNQAAIAVRDAARDVRDNPGNRTQLLTLAEAVARRDMIQGKVAQATAEAAHAFHALQVVLDNGAEAHDINALFEKETGRSLFQLEELAKRIANAETPEEAAKIAEDSKKPTFGQMGVEYVTNAYISGPFTHMWYAIGNAVNAIYDPLVYTPIASAVGKAREAITGEAIPDRVHLAESAAQLMAIGKGSQEGLRAAIKAWKDDQAVSLPGARPPMPHNHAIPGVLGTIIRLPGRSVGSIHSFFSVLRYEQNIHGLATRTAIGEGLDGADRDIRIAKLTSSPSPEMMELARVTNPLDVLAQKQAQKEGLYGSAVDRRIEELKATPTSEMKEQLTQAGNIQEATRQALKQLYMEPSNPDSFTGGISSVINKHPAAKMMVPFMKIGTQIESQAFLEGTPLALANRYTRAEVLYRNGGARGDMAVAKVAAGTALMGSAAMMAAQGMITGDGPEDPGRRAIWLLTHQPNAMQIGPITVPYKRLGPLGNQMRFAANMYDAMNNIDDDHVGKSAKAFIETFTKSVLDDNWMYGVKNALDAVYHPEEYGSQYLNNFAAGLIPFSVGLSQTAKEVDPYHRITNNMWESVENKVPLLSETLMPRRDVFGASIPNSGTVQSYTHDPTVAKLEQLQMGIGRVPKKINGIDLTEQQYDDFARLSGTMTKQRLDAMVRNPDFNAMPVGSQFKAIAKQVTKAREYARSAVLMQNPDIMRPSIAIKQKIAATGHK